MRGLLWTLVIWSATLLIARRYRHRSVLIDGWFSPENLGLVIALLGTFSIAGSSSAEEVLRSPLAYERIVRGGIAAVSLGISGPSLVRRLRHLTPGHKTLGGLMVYLCIALVSCLYSAAPFVSAAKVGELVAGLVPILAIAIGPDARRRLISTFYLTMTLLGALIAVGIVGFFALPSVFALVESRPGFILRETLAAPYAHSNAMSSFSAYLALFALGLFFTSDGSRKTPSLLVAMGAAGLILSSGRQGIAMFLVGAAVLMFVHRRMLLGLAVGPALGVLTYVYRDPIFAALSRNRPRNFTNFTGRLYWWEAALESWASHPWTGWGYAAGGRFVALASIGRGGVSSVHSGFIEALVGVGILGLSALLYVMTAIVRWSLKSLDTQPGLAIMIFPLILRTSVSMGFGGWLSPEFVLFALLAGMVDADARIASGRSSLATVSA